MTTEQTNTNSSTEVLAHTSFPSVGVPIDKPYLKIEKNSRGYNFEYKAMKDDIMTQEQIDAAIAQAQYISGRLLE